MINVEGIRKALEPYREDLGRGLLSHRWQWTELCAVAALTAAASGHRTSGQGFGASDAFGLNQSLRQRLIKANNAAPDGFARYQAVMAECEAIRAEQEAEATKAEPVMEGISA